MPISLQREIFEVEEIIPMERDIYSIDPHLYNTDLSFAGHDSQYSLHALHPYVAAINPPLAQKLIETYVPKRGNLLDPFSGGGGVLLESTLRGVQNAGGDVNPLSIILSRAKTTYINPLKIRATYNHIIAIAQKRYINIDPIIDPKLSFWFKQESIPYIAALISAIEEVTADKEDLNNLYKAIFSACVRDVMLTYRGEVRLRKLQETDLERFKPDVFKAFNKRYITAYERMPTLPKGAKSDIALRDIKKMEFSDESFDSIICSPPYGDDKNGVGYFQYSKNMLEWIGYSKADINTCKKLFLGSSKDLNSLPSSESLESSLKNVQNRSSLHYKEAVSFYFDYDLGLKEMARVVKKYIVIVIGNRVLSRTQFDNAQITVDFLQNIGINLKHHYTRELKKKRIANLGGDGGGIAKEHILVFEK